MKKIKKLRSSVPKQKSVARRMFEESVKRMKSLSARNVKAKPLHNSAKFNDKHPPLKDRTIRVTPLKPNGMLVRQLPETELSRKGLSLAKLFSTTPKHTKWLAESCIIKKLDKKKTKSGLPAIQARVYTHDPYSDIPEANRTYDLYVIGIDSQTTPINRQRRVLVSCSCPDYCFTHEYANAVHGASKIIYSNGEPPRVKNVGLAPGLCKHLVALTREIKEKGL